MPSPITIRPVRPADLKECARIMQQAFARIATRHGFAPDFPSVETVMPLMEFMGNHPAVYGVVAEADGKIVGSNFMDCRDAIHAVGPITVDPDQQARGIGRKLMRAVLDHSKDAIGIRLVQEAYNTASMSLYTSLGFDTREPLAMLIGKPQGRASGKGEARPMRQEDLAACAQLCNRIHGVDRQNELADSLKMFRPFVLTRDGRVVAYASAPTFWPLNHGVSETDQDMQDLLLGAAAANQDPIALLLPTRQSSLFRWCLSSGLRMIKPMTLMSMGRYQEPTGPFYPSVAY
ncbi:MAG TPA: GNAT family N-acetyltransferase [Tepidisphaeraceae bacterium]|nr:GNAT family N-acetyltransferase [Tepidisphaeraceae bacterium]